MPDLKPGAPQMDVLEQIVLAYIPNLDIEEIADVIWGETSYPQFFKLTTATRAA